MSFLSKLFKGQILKINEQIDNVSIIIMMSTAKRLLDKYRKYYGEEISPLLAAALVNRLFNKEPGNDVGEKFSKENKELIFNELSKIKDEPDICYMVSMTAHMKANIAGNSAQFTESLLRWISELDNLKIIIPIEKIKMPKSIDEFIEMARSFH
jgi:hypothetical protein